MSIFNESVKKRRNNNQFDLNYEMKTSGKFGEIIPIYWEETLPGDKCSINHEVKTELAPLLSNLDHMIDVHIDTFWVSYDSIWSNWRDFISGGERNDQNPTLPYVQINQANRESFKTGTLADHLGIPCWDRNATAPTITGTRNVNALPFRAYHHIRNNWYRDQDLETEIDILKDTDGLHADTSILLLRNAHHQDLFTQCRPEAQKGDPVNFLARELAVDPNIATFNGNVFSGGNITASASTGTGPTNDGYLKDGSSQSLDLYATVAQLRKGEALQAFYEAMQKGGNRYNEYLNTMWGVDDQDQRLQIPQLIHSSDHPLKVNEVITTSNNDNTTTDNNVAGQAYGRMSAYDQANINYTASDYGIVMTMVKYQPRSSYMKPLREIWTRNDRFQWYTDHLAEIGEAPILKHEVEWEIEDCNSSTNELEFGYNHRYHAFKQRHDQVSGDYRYSLNFRHMARSIGNDSPALSEGFTRIGDQGGTALTRIFNVIDPNLHYIWIHVYNDATYSRDVKYNSTPLN